MKRPTMLIQAMLDQLALDLDLSVERDKQRIAYRCEHEGLSFLTITLSSLSDALERGLEAGSFTCPSSFARHGRLPRFLGGFFKRVFALDGRLLPEPCPYTIAGIRQVCRFFKKLKLGCSPKREASAEKAFLAVEGELCRMTPSIERKDDVLDSISGIIWSQVFPELDDLSLVCHHGPGVTADRIRSNERYRIRKWNQRSESSFPSDLHCYPNYGYAADYSTGSLGEGGVDYLDIKDEEPVRVVFVPKTQSAPRVIAIEPSHVQYMQQSIKDLMYDVIESHRLTKRSIRFSDQSVNQRLAYRSSKDRRLATLDLKDASDRVHLHLVNRIFKTSGILEYLQDSRSLHATLPSGKNIILWKYASMGSAECFPVEASVFYTLIQSAMHIQDGLRPRTATILRYSGKIAIYGDDIIIPVEYTDTVVRYLESYALKVNVNKSFRFSHFRESCGGDYYNGIDVKPIYAGELPHDDARNWTPSSLMSWCSTADQFYEKGQWKICQVIRDMVCQVARSSIPRARECGPGLVFKSYLFTTKLRWNRDWQCWQQRRLVFTPVKTKDEIDGNDLACLNKWGINDELRKRLGAGSQKQKDYSHQRLGLPPQTDSFGMGGRLSDGQSPSFGRSHQWFLDVEGVRTSPVEVVVQDERVPGTCDSCRRPLQACSCATLDLRSYDLSHLDGGRGIDFLASVKRGCFKSKSRWVSLHS